MGAALSPQPVLTALQAALIVLTEGHLGTLDSPGKGQLRVGRRLAQCQPVWGREEVAGSRAAPGLAPDGLYSADAHQTLPDWRPWFLMQLPKPPTQAPGGVVQPWLCQQAEKHPLLKPPEAQPTPESRAGSPFSSWSCFYHT